MCAKEQSEKVLFHILVLDTLNKGSSGKFFSFQMALYNIGPNIQRGGGVAGGGGALKGALSADFRFEMLRTDIHNRRSSRRNGSRG